MEYLLGLLNSKFISYYFSNLRGNRSIDINPLILRQIPIIESTTKIQKHFVNQVNMLINLYIQKEDLQKSVIEFVLSEYNIRLNTRELLSLGWNKLNEILSKNKTILNVKQKEDLFQWFKAKQEIQRQFLNEIKSLENQIDQEVYELYGLNDEEIKLVESQT